MANATEDKNENVAVAGSVLPAVHSSVADSVLSSAVDSGSDASNRVADSGARTGVGYKFNDEDWARFAKNIVSRTLSDPYIQHRELGRLRTKYLKDKFNKSLKVTKDK